MNDLKNAIIEGEPEIARDKTLQLLNKGVSAYKIIKNIGEAFDIVGEKFEKHEYFVPDLVMSAESMNEVLPILLPKLEAGSVDFLGKIVIGVCKGDVHDIGKNIVVAMLRGAGFYVVDLGIDVPPQKFIEAIEKEKPQIIGSSSYISTTIDELKNLNEELKKAGVRNKVKYLIGGASVYPKHVEQVGADAFANDALDAVKVAKELAGK